MPQISRVTGNTSENLLVFINDATVSTGSGLANIVASSVNFSWLRDNMATISSGTATTGTLGTFSVSSFVQVSSTSSLGWYQFCPPDGVFVSGRKALVHLYGAPSMAPLPILIELTKTDNQSAMSTQTVSTALNLVANADKTGYSGSVNVSTAVGVSSFTIPVGVSSFAINVGVSSVNTGVNVSSVNGAAIVTSGVGIINVSTQTIDKAGYSVLPVGVSSFGIAVGVSSNADKVGYSTIDWVSTFPEQYRTVNATGTPIQMMYELLANITDMSNSATTRTLNSVTSHTALAITYGYDVALSSNPSSIKRTA